MKYVKYANIRDSFWIVFDLEDNEIKLYLIMLIKADFDEYLFERDVSDILEDIEELDIVINREITRLNSLII